VTHCDLSVSTTSEQLPAPDIAARLRAADWKSIQVKLLEYALFKIRRLRWNSASASDSLPKGLTAEDLVVQAIEKVFQGDRVWDPARCPDLISYLCSVIDSDVSHLVNSEENRVLRRLDDEVSGYVTPEREDAETLLLARERDERESADFGDFYEELTEFFEKDAPVRAILSSFMRNAKEGERIKPATVMAETGLPMIEIRNAMKRLRRKVLWKWRSNESV